MGSAMYVDMCQRLPCAMTMDHKLGVTCTGILVLAYLTSVIHKFNGVMRKEVALKEECSQLMCWGLAAFAGAQPIAILLILYQQQLWTNFYLMPAAVVGVSILGQFICEVLLVFWRDFSACQYCGGTSQIMDECGSSYGAVSSRWQ